MKYSTIMRESLPNLSPPSRGAWIEIPLDCCMIFSAASPPSQGAWIEIEEVQIMRRKMNGRPPRGGRGLKSHDPWGEHDTNKVAPLAGGVD